MTNLRNYRLPEQKNEDRYTPKELLRVVRTDRETGSSDIDVFARSMNLHARISIWDNSEGGRLSLEEEGQIRLSIDLNWDEMDVLALALQGTHNCWSGK